MKMVQRLLKHHDYYTMPNLVITKRRYAHGKTSINTVSIIVVLE
jgi:hypothetical protein